MQSVCRRYYPVCLCRLFLAQGFASLTPSCYSQGKRKFIDVWTQWGNFHSSGFPCPADKWTLSLFSTFLANSVQHSTIMVYLPAVGSLHIDQGFPDPPGRLPSSLESVTEHQAVTRSNSLPSSYWHLIDHLPRFWFILLQPLYVLGCLYFSELWLFEVSRIQLPVSQVLCLISIWVFRTWPLTLRWLLLACTFI